MNNGKVFYNIFKPKNRWLGMVKLFETIENLDNDTDYILNKNNDNIVIYLKGDKYNEQR